MAPFQRIPCTATNCNYSTPSEATDVATALQFMTLHTQQSHPATAAHTRPISKVETRARPDVTMDTPENDWRFFLSEWEDYKRVTGITGQSVLDELWSCMKGDLKRLAFDQGGKETLTTEDLMIKRIKSLAVTELHTAVHTVMLHEAKQTPTESAKAFAARVQGIASSCNFKKKCSCNPGTNVSFAEETVYRVVLAGLRDRDLQEKCLAAAYMKTVTNLTQLVQFCSAEESSKSSSPDSLVGALRNRSTYQFNKRQGQIRNNSNQRKPFLVCNRCDGARHADFSEETLKKDCPAFSVTCAKCNLLGHFTSLCKTNPATVAGIEQDSEQRQQEDTYAFALTDQDQDYSQSYVAAAVEEEEDTGFAYI